MTHYGITLDLADVDSIADGSTVAVTADDGVTFEVTSETGWAASSDPGVCRFGLSADQLDRLRWGRTVTVLPTGVDGSVHFTVDLVPVAR
jgi:hypothetical protein